jgi:hypothetical protein
MSSAMLVCAIPVDAATLTQMRFYVDSLFRDTATAIPGTLDLAYLLRLC